MEYERAEYETQHFGFSVEQMQLEHRLMVEKQAENLSETLAESIIKKSNISIKTADSIRGKSKAVTEKIMSTIANQLTKFDCLLEKHFSIPENILLAEDLRHENPYTLLDEEFYANRVAVMENTFKQNKYLLASLEAELQKYELIVPALKVESEVIDKLDDCFKANFNLQDINSVITNIDEVLLNAKHDEERELSS